MSSAEAERKDAEKRLERLQASTGVERFSRAVRQEVTEVLGIKPKAKAAASSTDQCIDYVGACVDGPGESCLRPKNGKAAVKSSSKGQKAGKGKGSDNVKASGKAEQKGKGKGKDRKKQKGKGKGKGKKGLKMVAKASPRLVLARAKEAKDEGFLRPSFFTSCI